MSSGLGAKGCEYVRGRLQTQQYSFRLASAVTELNLGYFSFLQVLSFVREPRENLRESLSVMRQLE